jgi:catechol 2,3-dioxygenase-like lactoylglutathione lyase family enzyme
MYRLGAASAGEALRWRDEERFLASVVAAVMAAPLLAHHGDTNYDLTANRIPGNNGVNHVGINVEKMDEAIAYYPKTFGFWEAAVLRDDKGQPTLAFIQVNRNTFIELGPATADRPAGITHFGLHVDDVKAATALLRQRGVKIDDPASAERSRSSPARPARPA